MTRIFTLIIIVILMVLAAAFAVVNANPIELNYFIGQMNLPLALALMLAFIVGALSALLFSMPKQMRLKRENSRLHKAAHMMKVP